LATIGVRFAVLEFSNVVVISLSTNLLYLLGLIVYVVFRGGIRNILKINPVFSNIVLKIFIILPLATSLILIMGMPSILFVKDYGPPSFTILFLSSLTIIIGMLIAHLAKIITYSKYFKGTIIGGFIVLFLIIAIVLSITILKNSAIIFNIIARETVTLFIIFALVVEAIGLLSNIGYIV